MILPTYRYLGNDQFEDLGVRYGDLQDPDGFVDQTRMLSAFVRGTVPMNVGDPVTVDLRWDLSGAALHTAGDDGPIQDGNEWGRRGREGCAVENWLAHQTWRSSNDGISGRVDGEGITDLLIAPDGIGIVGNSVFHIIQNETGHPERDRRFLLADHRRGGWTGQVSEIGPVEALGRGQLARRGPGDESESSELTMWCRRRHR